MFDRLRYFGVLAAVCLMAIGCADKKQIAKLNQDILHLQSENDALKQDLASARGELGKQSDEKQRLSDEVENLRQDLAGTGAEPGIRGGRIVINLPSSIYFDSGRSTLRKDAEKSLKKVGNIVKGRFPTEEIAVQGHTDNQPIKKTKSKYKSNLELSNERAETVWHFLDEKCALDPERMHTEGYSMYKPIAENKTRKGRQTNRRVEIVIVQE